MPADKWQCDSPHYLEYSQHRPANARTQRASGNDIDPLMAGTTTQTLPWQQLNRAVTVEVTG